jgi:hypothetical protein
MAGCFLPFVERPDPEESCELELLGDPLPFAAGLGVSHPPVFRLPSYLLFFDDPPEPPVPPDSPDPPWPVDGLGLTGGFGVCRPLSSRAGVLLGLCCRSDTASPSS